MMKISASFKGVYTLSNGREEVVVDNLVTDLGAAALLGVDNNTSNNTHSAARFHSSGARIHVGQGSTPPTFADTQLQTQLAAVRPVLDSSTARVRFTLYADRVLISHNMTATFPVGAVVGNVSEVGATAVNNHGAAVLVSRTVLPEALTVLATDQLIVSYRLEITVGRPASELTDFNFPGRSAMLLPHRGGELETVPASSYHALPRYGSFAASALLTQAQWDAWRTSQIAYDQMGTNPTSRTTQFISRTATSATYRVSLFWAASAATLQVAAVMIGGGYGVILSSTTGSIATASAQAGAIVFDPPLNKTADNELRLSYDVTYRWRDPD